MERTFKEDKATEELYHKQLLGMLKYQFGEAFRVADFQEDVTTGTDFVGCTSGTKVSARLRGLQYYDFQDLTIRSWRASGAATELDKIYQPDFAKYIFFAYHDERHILYFWLFDTGEVGRKIATQPDILNKDRKTAFRAIKFSQLKDIKK
jgi:hypothetical protein